MMVARQDDKWTPYVTLFNDQEPKPDWVVRHTHEMMFEDGYKGDIHVWTLVYPPERVAKPTPPPC